ncbi:MAG: addiction module antitoxin [Verrucomicrobia bacterium]|nr:addiction module antitoxin [Verrucomicrobiota bacterium]
MTKQLTITLDEEVYRGLRKLVRDDQISGYIEKLVRPHLPPADLEEGYRAMAADAQREEEALEWSENLIGDVTHETR